MQEIVLANDTEPPLKYSFKNHLQQALLPFRSSLLLLPSDFSQDPKALTSSAEGGS